MLDLQKIDTDYIVTGTIKTQMDDTWDLLSFILYGDEQYADKLIYANKYKKTYYFVESDVEIDIPLIDTTNEENLPPWKRK